MDENSVLALGLGLTPPWRLINQRLETGRQPHELHLQVAAERGSLFSCPVCGTPCKAADFTEVTWRSMNFFQHHCYITAKLPSTNCAEHRVLQITAPWARARSRFTLLFEQAALTLVCKMPVPAVARIIDITEKRLWRIVEHYVGRAVERLDLSKLAAVGLDETAAKRGHTHVTVFINLDRTDKPVVFVTPGRGKETVVKFRAFLAEHGDSPPRIAEVVCDTSGAFTAAVGENQIGNDRYKSTVQSTIAAERNAAIEYWTTQMPLASTEQIAVHAGTTATSVLRWRKAQSHGSAGPHTLAAERVSDVAVADDRSATSLISFGPFRSPNQALVFEALRSTPLMRNLSDAVLDRLAAITKMVDCPEDSEICAQGEPADELFIVLDGQLVGFSSIANGPTTVVEVIRLGETLGLATVLARLPRMIGVRAVTACRLLAIEAPGLLALVEQVPALITVLLRAAANEFHALVRQVCDLKLRTAPQRLGCYLLSLTPGGPANTTALRLPFDKGLLAARLGCRQENLSRAFATLRGFGVETHGARVILRDIAKLKAYSEPDEDSVSCD